ncbi:hypothetical protein EHW99_0369 [Erwinia amylovora]|uniref:Uncharacterized protein n=3 Tax=Erwinia amylovora TaxID=552 RepID=A0A830ZW22_ERWAM|nr:hypothetical protein EaACW_3270 [Erwinia amylovora ACW56400]QJQ53076.1 hypothetical protein EHX00_0369 [Erwinia amylovora]CBA23300.1 hypothetical protein predicted by Glimmer/Critica [Erwinia amylovora CFBP1430]CBX82132.1 hypothetical protein predicted by Glimmer/Critica [Erwinia amylovora ATCC BAA-2158]CCO80109.1 hypothetical protein BN432_3339 [Erwinia amylovora Ea356]CCO83913.1 hypothetical protein BN433_3365 [Erwinia amylovora Ea266]CCO87675.1 hypothetical protein BN434_3315 [Erwinia a
MNFYWINPFINTESASARKILEHIPITDDRIQKIIIHICLFY